MVPDEAEAFLDEHLAQTSRVLGPDDALLVDRDPQVEAHAEAVRAGTRRSA
jgi:hypothetical protein